MDFKHILAASDLSSGATQVVERAAFLAQQSQASLHLVHVIPALSWKMFGRALIEHPLITEKHLYDAALAQLQATAVAVRQDHGITVHAHVDIGRPHVRLAEYARQHSIGLTVMGAHDDNVVRDLFIGSTTLKFLRVGTQPILIVRSAPELTYRRILVAVDFSAVSRLVVETAMAFAPQASVSVLHVYDVFFEGKMQYAGVEQTVLQRYRDAAQVEASQRMAEFMGGFPPRPELLSLVRYGHAARTILEQAKQLDIDLIVMGKLGSSELGELLLGSVTENVLSYPGCDILLVAAP